MVNILTAGALLSLKMDFKGKSCLANDWQTRQEGSPAPLLRGGLGLCQDMAQEQVTLWGNHPPWPAFCCILVGSSPWHSVSPFLANNLFQSCESHWNTWACGLHRGCSHAFIWIVSQEMAWFPPSLLCMSPEPCSLPSHSVRHPLQSSDQNLEA